MNTYFVNIGKILAEKIPNTSPINLTNLASPPHSFFMDPVTNEEIINITNSLNHSMMIYPQIC
jgi:hypothetical protein